MRSLINLFEESVKKYADNIMLWQKDNDQYAGTNYRQAHDRVRKFAAGLMDLGLRKGDRVALLAEGCNDWVISELGILYNGAVNVPLSVKLIEKEEISFRLGHSGARFVITTKAQLGKVLNAIADLPGIDYVITLQKTDNSSQQVIDFESVLEKGKHFLENNIDKFQHRVESVKEDDHANICYTSGTTADPKGIILSHRNYTANVEQSASLFTIPEWYSTLLILPWDHSFAHTCGIYTVIKYGASLASVKSGSTALETLKNIPKNIQETRPVFLLSVPALAKRFRMNIEKGVQEKGRFLENFFKHALKMAYLYHGTGYDKGTGWRKLLWPLYQLYDVILFRKIRESFGGRLKFFIGGGALLDIELQKFFSAIGIPMFQGYGLSESAPVISSNNFEKHKMGSSGTLVANLELKICDENGKSLPTGEKGEIVVKGENIMKGYWNNERATKETLKDGWLYTGDLGYMDNNGFLYVLGRFKSLLIANDGEKFSPEGIEEAFSEKSPFIEQCMLYNNQKPYSVCLIFPNQAAINKYLKDHHVPDHEKADKALKKIAEELLKYRKGGEFDTMFPQRWLPAAIGILKEGFTEENHLMNSTMKMVRPKITEFYADLLEYLYLPEAKNINNSANTEAVQMFIK